MRVKSTGTDPPPRQQQIIVQIRVDLFRNRYNEDAQALARFGEGGEEMTDEITQQTLLPGVKDPNLWMVKCVPGTEKETLLKLMQKYISHEHSDDPNYEPSQIRLFLNLSL